MAYLRGPIPWTWLQRAILLGGSALATGLAVWHLRTLTKSLTFKASLGQLRKWTGLTERSTRAGLHKLEGTGLVTVERPAGQSPIITLHEPSTEPDAFQNQEDPARAYTACMTPGASSAASPGNMRSALAAATGTSKTRQLTP